MTRTENNPPSRKKLNILEWLNDAFEYFKIRLSVNPKITIHNSKFSIRYVFIQIHNDFKISLIIILIFRNH